MGRENSFPQGAILLTGTGIIPPDAFTLAVNDQVIIEIEGIGVPEKPDWPGGLLRVRNVGDEGEYESPFSKQHLRPNGRAVVMTLVHADCRPPSLHC